MTGITVKVGHTSIRPVVVQDGPILVGGMGPGVGPEGPQGPEGPEGPPGVAGPPGAITYSWLMDNPVHRAGWTYSADGARRTFGVIPDPLGRDSLGFTLVQHSPAPTVFTQSNQDSCSFYSPQIPVLAGDRVTFHYVLSWNRTADSLVGDVDVPPFREPGYSVADDRSGTMQRGSISVYSDDSVSTYWDGAVMEPRWDFYAGGWLYTGGYFHGLETSVLAVEDCNLYGQVRIAPIWANVAGTAHLCQASVVIARPGGSAGGGGSGPDFRYVHDQSSPSTTWTIAHNLGGFPQVTTVDSAGDVFEGDVSYPNANVVVVTLSAPQGGKAYLS